MTPPTKRSPIRLNRNLKFRVSATTRPAPSKSEAAAFYRPYAGVGSRKGLPVAVEQKAVVIGSELADRDWTLRSGHAEGCDQAFERGCDLKGGKKEIFLPRKGFKGSTSKLYHETPEMYELAGRYYGIKATDRPYDKASENKRWSGLPDAYKPYHARNGCQIYGENLDHLTDTVVCWTPNGDITGGTGQALRLVQEYLESGEVMVFNLGSPEYADMPALDIIQHILERTHPAPKQGTLLL